MRPARAASLPALALLLWPAAALPQVAAEGPAADAPADTIADTPDPTTALALPPGAALTLEVNEPQGTYPLPTGVWDGDLPVERIDGTVLRRAWRIDGRGLETAALLAPLRDQLVAQGYEIIVECETDACGGFDFRFATDVLPPPEMYVDLGAFRFVSARRPGGEAASILVSRSPFAGFVQIVRVSPGGTQPLVATPAVAGAVRAAVPVITGEFAARLEQEGRIVLIDLAFDSGAAALGAGPFDSLAALADYLRANPDRRVALVGHTDATGSLDGNIALSRLRAASVVERLVSAYGIPRAQLDAQGMGYLAPLATNLTEAGREANRRVEVIVTSTP